MPETFYSSLLMKVAWEEKIRNESVAKTIFVQEVLVTKAKYPLSFNYINLMLTRCKERDYEKLVFQISQENYNKTKDEVLVYAKLRAVEIEIIK